MNEPVKHPDQYLPYDFRVLRALRTQHDLTIGQVSQKSGVSTAVISKLERNCSQAGLETLHRLARVFGLNASELLSLAESRVAQTASETCRKTEAFVFRELEYGNARCQLVTAPAGARLSRPDIHGDDFEVCWVVDGRLAFRLPDEHHELATGEAIQFDAVLEHTYEALEDVTFLLVHLRKQKRF